MLSDLERKNIAEAIREDAYQARGVQKLLCRGKCMVPTLDNNVEVLVKDCQPYNLSIGDIILYKYKGNLMLHRFIYKTKGRDGLLRIVTKPDALHLFDPPHEESSLIGKVVEIDRSGRKLETQRHLWPLAFRIIGILSLLEAVTFLVLHHIRITVFKRFILRYQHEHVILKVLRAPKLMFIRATTVFMLFSRPEHDPSK